MTFGDPATGSVLIADSTLRAGITVMSVLPFAFSRRLRGVPSPLSCQQTHSTFRAGMRPVNLTSDSASFMV